MVMGQRPEVATATPAVAAVDLVGLAQQMANALVRVPFRRPWEGRSNVAANVATSVTRETIRSFMGYASALPVPEWRSLEMALDGLCKVVMPPIVDAEGVATERTEIAGVPGIWYRPKAVPPVGRILYLHGGGYIGTSPRMYAFFTAALARETSCEVFVADYRLAPEFPFPAGLDDAMAVLGQLLDEGTPSERLFLAGDSGGGGLVGSVLYRLQADQLSRPGGVVLFSPEVDLRLDEPSVTDNAPFDILPWNIPTSSYLHGASPDAAVVSAIDQDVGRWPPTFVAFGSDEMFRDPIRRLADLLVLAGVETSVIEEAGMFHVFPILMPWAEASRRVYVEVGRFVRELAPGPLSVPGSASPV